MRDVVGELEPAVRSRGMRFLTSFHHSWNQDYYTRREGWPTSSDDPELRLLYGNLPREEFLELWEGKLDEVVDRYEPDLVYFDFALGDIELDSRRRFVRSYLDHGCARRADVVVTYKGGDLPFDVGVEDHEALSFGELAELPWLTDMTVTSVLGTFIGPWGYAENPARIFDAVVSTRPPRPVLHHLIDVVSKNGQLLLNVAPPADGRIPDDQRELLLAIGAWLDRFGEAIYETRPWVVSGHGPTAPPEGSEALQPMPRYTAQDVRYTRRGDDRVYAILLGWPGEGVETLLTGIPEARALDVRDVRVLGSDEAITWSAGAAGLRVTSPSRAPDDIALVYRIDLEAP